jgi:hypothetical protein
MTIRITKSLKKLELALELSRHEVIKKDGFIDFFFNFSSKKENTKTSNFQSMFSKYLWEELSKKTGHSKIRHILTKVIVEYVVHEPMIDPGAMVTLGNQIQMHVNRLGNYIFGYRACNWKASPNITLVAKKFFSNLVLMEAKDTDYPNKSGWKTRKVKRRAYDEKTDLASIYLKKPESFFMD